jgi:hypothetical protein
MADIDIGRALSGLGAAFKNEMPAFIQQTRQEDALALQQEDRNRAIALQDEELAEKRKITMFKDAQTGQQLLLSGDLAGVVALMEDRLNILGNVPNVDTKHTRNNLYLAKLAATGDKGAEQELTRQFDNTVTVGRRSNLIGSEMPSAFRSLQLQAQAAGLEGDEYKRFMRFGGGSADEGAAKTEFFDNGAVLEKPRNGPPKLFVNGQQIVDPKEFAIQMDLAVASGPLLAGETATATTRGGREEGRAQDYIVKGQSAADSTAVIRRSLALLEKVKTGGLGRTTMLAAKRMFGAEGADEGELSASLGKAVLAQLRETFGAAFTAQEGESLKEIEAGFGSSVETNTRLLNNSLRIAQRAADRGIRAAESRDDYESASEIEMALDFDLGVFESEYSSFGESVPPFPSAFAGSLTEEDWAKMTDTERSAFQ